MNILSMEAELAMPDPCVKLRNVNTYKYLNKYDKFASYDDMRNSQKYNILKGI